MIKLYEDFILDCSEAGGAQVSHVTKEYEICDSGGAKCVVYVFAIGDAFDRNDSVKDLQFFNTSGAINNVLANLWIAMPKLQIHVHRNYSYSKKTISKKRKMVEASLN